MFKLATVWNFISIFNVCSGQVSTHPFGLEDYNVATIGAFGDAEHRGVRWYDDKHSSNEKASNLKSSATLDSRTKAYRQCTPCPHDMLKSYNNLGVKWICGAYQLHISIALLNKTEIHEVNNDLKAANTRRKTHRSTSSSSGDFKKDDNNLGGKSESLEISDSSSSSESVDRDKKSTPAGTGWRKWHRKCTPCPDDMVKKWNDRSIKWICGGYQRARRSFKSSCMMHYRNCQDGTIKYWAINT
ncbi:unnamed protein product, partial [Leptidea sinapis]